MSQTISPSPPDVLRAKAWESMHARRHPSNSTESASDEVVVAATKGVAAIWRSAAAAGDCRAEPASQVDVWRPATVDRVMNARVQQHQRRELGRKILSLARIARPTRDEQ